jgi:hypothetical protein
MTPKLTEMQEVDTARLWRAFGFSCRGNRDGVRCPAAKNAVRAVGSAWIDGSWWLQSDVLRWRCLVTERRLLTRSSPFCLALRTLNLVPSRTTASHHLLPPHPSSPRSAPAVASPCSITAAPIHQPAVAAGPHLADAAASFVTGTRIPRALQRVAHCRSSRAHRLPLAVLGLHNAI